MALDAIGVIFTAKDLASAVISKLENNFNSLDKKVSEGFAPRFGQSMALVGAGLSTVGAGVLGLKVLNGFLEDATRFEANVARLGSISGATAKELEMLRQKGLELGVAFEFTPDDAVLGMKELASAGFNAQQTLDTINDTLLFASASQGEINIESAAEAMASSIRGFGLEVSDSARVVDVLTKSTSVSALKFSELSLMLGNTAADASLANQSFEMTVATLGALRNTGLTSLRASEKLRIALRNLTDPKAIEMANSLGIALRGNDGKLRSMDKIVADLQPKLDGLGQLQKEAALGTLFGKEALSVYNAVSNATFESIENGTKVVYKGATALTMMNEQLHNSTGEARKFQAEYLATTEGVNKLMQGTFETISIVLGTPLTKLMNTVKRNFLQGINMILEFLMKYPKFTEFIVMAALAVATFAVAVGSVVALIGGIQLFNLALGFLGITLGGILLVFAQVAVVIGLLVGAFFLIKKAFDTNFAGIADFFGKMWDNLSLFFQGVVGLIQDGEISAALNEQLDKMGVGEYVDAALRMFFRLKTAVVEFFQGFMDGFRTYAEPGFTLLVEAIKSIFSSIGQLTGTTFSFFDSASGGAEDFGGQLVTIGSVFGFIGSMIGSVLGLIASGFATIASILGFVFSLAVDIANIFLSIGNGIVSAFVTSGNLIMNLWTNIKDVIMSTISAFTDNPLVRFAMDKMGISSAESPVIAPAAPGGGVLAVPTAGLDTGILAQDANVNAQMTAAQANNQSMMSAMQGGGEQRIVTILNVDGVKMAESVNKVNKNKQLARGGQQ